MTNRKFAVEDKKFRACCKAMKIEPTKRQASKYRNEKGLAYSFRNEFENKKIV